MSVFALSVIESRFMGYCKIVALGMIGRDPETRFVGSATVTSFSLAAETGFGDKKSTTWYSVSAWGKQGDIIQQRLSKGDQILVDGELSERKYTKSDGTQGLSLDIRLANFSFIGEGGRSRGGARQAGNGGRRKPSSSYDESENFDDDVPF